VTSARSLAANRENATKSTVRGLAKVSLDPAAMLCGTASTLPISATRDFLKSALSFAQTWTLRLPLFLENSRITPPR
jgi:hypothetical protein